MIGFVPQNFFNSAGFCFHKSLPGWLVLCYTVAMTDVLFRKIIQKLVRYLPREDIQNLDNTIHHQLMRRDSQFPEHLSYWYWEKQIDNWDSCPSPIRPSEGDLEIYRSFLPQKGNKMRILILGSTPELRDLAAQVTEEKVYVADFSYRMPAAMLPYTFFVDPMRETWVRSNWFELPFPEKFFDLILGDLMLQQLPPDRETEFLAKMQELLKRGGVFLSRFHFLDKELQTGSLDSIFQEVTTSKLSDEEKFTWLKLRVLWLLADLDTRTLRRQAAYDRFKEYIESKKIQSSLVDMVLKNLFEYKDSNRTWAPPSSEEALETILQKSFSVVGREYVNDYKYAKYYPIFKLSPLS